MSDSETGRCPAPECGFQNVPQARFCEACGLNLQQKCPNPNCGAHIRAQQKFCRDCGEPLSPIAGVATQVRTPKHLAEQLRNANLSSAGERKHATVLFADIANSTQLLRDHDPEDAKRILDSSIDVMVKAVHHYEGTIVRLQGDGVVASFGAPIAREDHALWACCAAWEMQDAIKRHSIDTRREYGVPIQMRVGIDSGPVVASVKYQEGNFREIRVDGVPMHIAARLEALAAPGTILLARENVDLREGFVHLGPPERVTLKGIDHEVEVCELTGVNTHMRFQAFALRDLTKFVGRQDEMELLARSARRAAEGYGQVVGLVGEAGVGKSRIFWEFTSHHMNDWLVLAAGSVSYGKATSYLPLIDLLTHYFEIQTTDDERRVREKVSGRLYGLQENLINQLPLFLAALGVLVTEDTWAKLAPAERQRQIFTALKHLFLRESQLRPLCLVFEDLHWIDVETEAFLDMLLESVPASRILLLVNYRPEYQMRWATRTFYSQARVDPLPVKSAEEFLDTLLGTNPELDAIKHALVEATEGNPLFLEESVRSLIERGLISGADGVWRPTTGLPALFVPPSVEVVIAARIDRLDAHLKEILQYAAVIGNDVPQALLEAVTGLPRNELERAVRELQSAEFLYEKTLFPETEYRFKHSMTREVAYSSLVRNRRIAMHASAARALLTLADKRIEEQIERVATHAEQGALWDMAVEYLQRSGAKALGLHANAEAVSYFERAIKALRQQPESRSNLEHAVDLRFELRNALTPLGEIDRILGCLNEIGPIVDILNDKPRKVRYVEYRCNHHFLAGEQRQSIELGEIGLELARECGDRRLESELLFRLGQSYHALGNYRAAIALLQQSIELTSDKYERDRFELTVIPGVVSRTWLASALTECGDFASAMTQATRALDIAEAAEHPLSQALGWLAVGQVSLRRGEDESAVTAMERGMALSDKWSLRVWRLRLISALGVAYARWGQTEKGLEYAQEALAAAQEMRLVMDQALLLIRVGQASLLAGLFREAIASGKQALQLALAHDAKGDEAWARFLIGRSCWASEPPELDVAEEQLLKSMELARECDARPLVAFCQTTLGALRARRGDAAGAHEFTATADATYAALGLQPISIYPVPGDRGAA